MPKVVRLPDTVAARRGIERLLGKYVKARREAPLCHASPAALKRILHLVPDVRGRRLGRMPLPDFQLARSIRHMQNLP